MKQMNAFEKLKFTIDRIGLQYIPSNDQQTITGQTVYKYTRNNQQQQEQEAQQNHIPYFNTQPAGHSQHSFKHHRTQFLTSELQQQKILHQNQQKNLIVEITSLSSKLKQCELRYTIKCQENQRLKEEMDSRMRENAELRACLVEAQQKSAKKMTESGVHDRQRKLREEIDRVNATVMDLANQLNAEKTMRKGLQKEIEQTKGKTQEMEMLGVSERGQLKKQVESMQHQLEKRAELLEHSIKASRDEKIAHKIEVAEMKEKYEAKIEILQQEISGSRQQIYDLKNQLTQHKHLVTSLQKDLTTSTQSHTTLSTTLTTLRTENNQSLQTITTLKEKIQELRLQLTYHQHELEQERSNTKVKVVEVRDESMEMELAMYKKQLKEVLKEKSILESVRREYTVVGEDRCVLNVTSKVSQ